MAYDIDRLPNLIVLENEGDTSVASIAFDVSAWDALYPAGVYSIRYTRCGETDVYPEASGNVSHAAGVLTWTPGAAVLDVPGRGSVVIRCTEADVLKNSRMTYYYVVPGMTASLITPEPLIDYIEKWGAVSLEVTTLDEGEPASGAVTQDSTGTHLALGIPPDTATAAAIVAQGLAEDAQGFAEDAQGLAEDAQGFAEDAQGLAETAQGLAEAARDLTLGYAGDADDSASAAAASAAQLAAGVASPAGVYATLVALEEAYLTGDTHIYVVTADGHWYYWNGSVWADGGVYQATDFSDCYTEANEPWEV